MKQDETSVGTDTLRIGLFNRKVNLGRLRPPLAYSIRFGEDSTTFRRTEVGDSPDLASKMTVVQKMTHLLRRGAMTPDEIASEIDEKKETITRTTRRYKGLFLVLPDRRIAIIDRNA